MFAFLIFDFCCCVLPLLNPGKRLESPVAQIWMLMHMVYPYGSDRGAVKYRLIVSLYSLKYGVKSSKGEVD